MKEGEEENRLRFAPERIRNAKVTKSNRLVEARYRLSVQEKRLILLYISMLSPNHEDLPTVTLRVKDIVDAIGVRGNAYMDELKKIIRRLRSRIVEIPKPDGGFIITGWVHEAEYYPSRGEIVLRLSASMKKELLKLRKAYTRYRLSEILKLRSFYSIRIYELLKQYENVGRRTFTLEDLKEILKIERGEYVRYGHFKSRVILPAYRELKEKTDIYFEFNEIKQCRKVVAIEFVIHRRKEKEPQKLSKGKPFERLPDKVKDAVLEYLRTKDNIKSPIAVAKSMSDYEIEDAAYEILRHMIYFSNGQVKDPELEEEIYRLREENPQMKWAELLEVALEKRGI